MESLPASVDRMKLRPWFMKRPVVAMIVPVREGGREGGGREGGGGRG